jgi:hypothetical protein
MSVEQPVVEELGPLGLGSVCGVVWRKLQEMESKLAKCDGAHSHELVESEAHSEVVCLCA